MALDVTVGTATSTSYATVAEADTIVAWKGSDAWTNAIDATKESALTAAVSFMDTIAYELPRVTTGQALRLPTTSMYDNDGTLIVPERVKEAQSYLALALLEDPNIMGGGGSGPVSEVSVPGAFSVTFQDSSEDTLGLPREVYARLERYILRSGIPTSGGIYDVSRGG